MVERSIFLKLSQPKDATVSKDKSFIAIVVLDILKKLHRHKTGDKKGSIQGGEKTLTFLNYMLQSIF